MTNQKSKKKVKSIKKSGEFDIFTFCLAKISEKSQKEDC